MGDQPYFERQVGGNCRIHAINSLFAGPVLSAEKLKDYSDAFDNQYESPITFQFDGVQSDTLTLVSFVIEDMTDYRTLIVCPGRIQDLLQECGESNISDLVQDDVPAVLLFNDHHIWTVRRHQNEWWNLDSLGGRPQKLGNLNRLRRDKTGFIFIYEGLGIQRQLLPLLSRRLRWELDHHGADIQEWDRGETPLFAFLRLFVHEDEAIMEMYFDILKTWSRVFQNDEIRVDKMAPLLDFAHSKLVDMEANL
ncbi:MAG: Josephin domain-containing protein [Gammaproteobacteria bacterium]|nr:Josephin domain-containing protein [Gammaproteobacteria bacterium]